MWVLDYQMPGFHGKMKSSQRLLRPLHPLHPCTVFTNLPAENGRPQTEAFPHLPFAVSIATGVCPYGAGPLSFSYSGENEGGIGLTEREPSSNV